MYFLASDLVLKFSSSFLLTSTERSVGVIFFILLKLYYNKEELPRLNCTVIFKTDQQWILKSNRKSLCECIRSMLFFSGTCDERCSRITQLLTQFISGDILSHKLHDVHKMTILLPTVYKRLDISLIRNRYCHKASQFLGGNAVSFGKACKSAR